MREMGYFKINTFERFYKLQDFSEILLDGKY